MKWSWAAHINRLENDAPHVFALGDHPTTRKVVEGDQYCKACNIMILYMCTLLFSMQFYCLYSVC